MAGLSIAVMRQDYHKLGSDWDRPPLSEPNLAAGGHKRADGAVNLCTAKIRFSAIVLVNERRL